MFLITEFCVANYTEVMKGLWAKKYSKMKQQQIESGDKSSEKSTNSHSKNGVVRRSDLDNSKQVIFFSLQVVRRRKGTIMCRIFSIIQNRNEEDKIKVINFIFSTFKNI